MRSAGYAQHWGPPHKSAMASEAPRPTWPAGFDFSSLYSDQDATGPAKIRFADQVQLFFFRGTGDHPNHHPDDVSRGVTVLGLYSAAVALTHWRRSIQGLRFVLEHATHNHDQAVTYVRGHWLRDTKSHAPLASNTAGEFERTFSGLGLDVDGAVAAYDVHDTFVHARTTDRLGTDEAETDDGETGMIESVTSTWRPRAAPLTPPKSLEHPGDKLLARMEQAATRPKKLDDTETETVIPFTSLRKMSQSNPGSRRGSLRQTVVAFGHTESYTIPQPVPVPGPDDTLQPGAGSSPMRSESSVMVQGKGGMRRSQSSSSVVPVGSFSQKEMRARRRKSLKEKRLSINSQDGADSGEEASLRLLVRASVEALSAAESENVRGALSGLGSGMIRGPQAWM